MRVKMQHQHLYCLFFLLYHAHDRGHGRDRENVHRDIHHHRILLHDDVHDHENVNCLVLLLQHHPHLYRRVNDCETLFHHLHYCPPYVNDRVRALFLHEHDFSLHDYDHVLRDRDHINLQQFHHPYDNEYHPNVIFSSKHS